MRIALSSAPDWELVDGDEDVRGWPVRHPDGSPLGTVADLLIDTDFEQIAELILGDGSRVAADEVDLGERVVNLLPGARVRPAPTRGIGVSRVPATPAPAPRDGVPAPAEPATAEVRLAEFEETQAMPAPAGVEAAGASDGDAQAEHAAAQAVSAPAAASAPAVSPPAVQALPDPVVPAPTPDAVAIAVSKRIVEERHSVDVPVTQDRVVVRREIVDRPATGDEQPYWDGDEYRIPVVAERIEIRRVLRVVEELVVRRDQVHDVEHVEETVRREAVTVREEGEPERG